MSTSRSFGSGGSGTGLLLPPAEVPRRPSRRGEAPAGPPPPPRDRGDGEGGRGGDGDDEERPGDALSFGAAELGLGIVIVAVSTFFTVFVAAYFLLRRNSDTWPPAGFAGVPRGLWASTALLAASSAALVRARRSARFFGERDGLRTARGWVVAALLLGVAFVVTQAWIWRELASAGTSIESDAYWMAFYSLTALHVAHVAGGLGYLVRVLARMYRPPTTSTLGLDWTKPLHLGSIYWHFMGGVWLALFAVLYLSA